MIDKIRQYYEKKRRMAIVKRFLGSNIRGKNILIYWTTTSEKPCPDCLRFKKESPFTPETLTAVPGDGTTQCKDKCGCNLVVWREGQPPLPKSITNKE